MSPNDVARIGIVDIWRKGSADGDWVGAEMVGPIGIAAKIQFVAETKVRE